MSCTLPFSTVEGDLNFKYTLFYFKNTPEKINRCLIRSIFLFYYLAFNIKRLELSSEGLSIDSRATFCGGIFLVKD